MTEKHSVDYNCRRISYDTNKTYTDLKIKKTNGSQTANFEITDPTNEIKKVKIQGINDSRTASKIKKQAIAYLKEIQQKLAKNGASKSQNEYLYAQVYTKVLSVMKHSNTKGHNLAEEFEEINTSIIEQTRIELTSLKNSFNPADITNYVNVTSLITGLGYYLLMPENAEIPDFGMKTKHSKKEIAIETIGIGAALASMLYLANRKDISGMLKLAKENGWVLKKIGY